MELPFELKEIIFEKNIYSIISKTFTHTIPHISEKEYSFVCKGKFFHMYQIDWWTLDWAIKWNKLDLFYWIYKNYPQLFHDKIVETVILRSGNLTIVKFLVERGYKCFQRGLSWAAARGDLDLLIYLYENFPNELTSESLIEATRHGQLEMIKWFDKIAPHLFSPLIMDLAAEGGYLEIVQWLHYNRSDGCTVSAINGATLGGHYKVVLWLKENRTEGWTDWAISLATINGNFKIVKLLAEQRDYPEAIRLARENAEDRQEILNFLLNLRYKS